MTGGLQMSNNKNNKEGAYASLTGFRRAIPIILFAAAIFIALCFITQNTGALGVAIGGFLLGSFSIGGYFIPVLFAVHAFFYPSDVQRKRVISRLVFSVLLVIAISAFAHAISIFGNEPVFSAADFYNNGKMNIGGGFVGGTIAFAIIKVLGYAGMIILTVTFFALYITYFLAGERNIIKRTFKKLLYSFVNFGAKAEKNLTDRKKKKNEIKDKKEKAALQRIEEKKAAKKQLPKDSPLYDDEFFAVDNGLSELKIEELGINESRNREDIELNPTLQERVFPKSRVEETKDDEPKYTPKKTVNSDYGFSTDESKYTFEKETGDIILEKSPFDTDFASPNSDSADSIFTKDFNAFDFALNEKLASKQSTHRQARNGGVNEYAEPITPSFSESDIAAARRRAESEMKDTSKAEEPRRPEATTAANQNVYMGTAFGTQSERVEQKSEPIYAAADSYRENKKANYVPPVAKIAFEESEKPAEQKTAEIYRETVEKSTDIPVYSHSVSQKVEESQFKPFDANLPKVEEVYNFSVENRESGIMINRAPIVDEAPKNDKTDNTLLVFSEGDNQPIADVKIEETISADEDKNDFLSGFTAPMPYEKTAEGNVFTFEDESEDDGEDIADDDGENDDSAELEFGTEIPEEKQNPEINEYRKMFNIFSEVKTTPVEEVEEEEEDTTDFMGGDVDAEDAEDEFNAEENDVPFELVKKPEPKPEPKPAPEVKKEERPDYSNFKFPPIDLLAKGQDSEDPTIAAEIQENGEKLIDALAQFDVRASIKGVDRGPRITRYEIVPARGVKVSRVLNLFDDIALNLAAEGIRMEAPIPGKSAIGVEIPNKHPTTVMLRDLLESDEFKNESSKTFSCVGKDVTGNPVFGDIAKMPHILVAGATGMGKSVCINSILISILYKARPDEVKFIMVDPKTVEFTMYNGIPHLLIPVVTDVKQAAGALMWAIDEMNRRYELMAKHEVRKLDSYNDLVRENPALGEPLPKIVIVIDELNDLMQQVRKPVEGLITNITQKARAAGIHMIIGTQRPSVDVITGVIKANVPSRISCKVTALTDSRTILDQAGAEKLLDKGDMLFAPVGKPKPIRVQGAFVSDGEVEKIMKFLKSNVKGAIYDQQALEEINRAAQKCNKGKDDDDFRDDDGTDEGVGYLNDKQFLEAVDLAIKQGKISTSLIQRKISIGYGKAAKFIDIMESMSLVSEPNGQKPRDVLVSREEWHEILARRSLDD